MNRQPPSGNPAVSEDLDQQLDSNFSPSQVNFNGQTSSAIYGVSCCVTGSVGSGSGFRGFLDPVPYSEFGSGSRNLKHSTKKG